MHLSFLQLAAEKETPFLVQLENVWPFLSCDSFILFSFYLCSAAVIFFSTNFRNSVESIIVGSFRIKDIHSCVWRTVMPKPGAEGSVDSIPTGGRADSAHPLLLAHPFFLLQASQKKIDFFYREKRNGFYLHQQSYCLFKLIGFFFIFCWVRDCFLATLGNVYTDRNISENSY